MIPEFNLPDPIVHGEGEVRLPAMESMPESDLRFLIESDPRAEIIDRARAELERRG